MYIANGGGLFKGIISEFTVNTYFEDHQEDQALLDSTFKSILKVNLRDYVADNTFNSITVQIKKYSTAAIADRDPRGNLNPHTPTCLEMRLVNANDDNDLFSDVVDIANAPEKTLSVLQAKKTISTNAFVRIAIQARMKSNCVNSDASYFRLFVDREGVNVTNGNNLNPPQFLYIPTTVAAADHSQYIINHPLNKNLSPRFEMPISRLTIVNFPESQPLGSILDTSFKDVLKIDLRKMNLENSSFENLKVQIKKYSTQEIADRDPRGNLTPHTPTCIEMRVVDTAQGRQDVLSSVIDIGNAPEKILPILAVNKTLQFALVTPTIQARVKNNCFQNDAKFFRVVVEKDDVSVTSGEYRGSADVIYDPSAAQNQNSYLTNHQPRNVSSRFELSQIDPQPTGQITIQPSDPPLIINIQDQNLAIREIFRFKVETTPSRYVNIKTITFKLKEDEPLSVMANHLVYFLVDADNNESISASPIIDAEAKTVSFNFFPPNTELNPEMCRVDINRCRYKKVLPTGKNLSLRVMPNVNFREYIIGRTIRIGFDSVNNISLWGDNEHFSSDQQGSMWGETTYTFSNSAAAPAADEIQREPPPVVEVCNAVHICAHSIVADTIPAATFSSGAATTAPVLGFTISPGRDAMLSMVKARLDTTLLDAAPGARIKAQLVIVNTEGVERQFFRPIAPVNNVFTFSGFNQVLATGHPTHFLIKVKIEDDPEANAIQHFKLLINPGDIYLNRYHSVTLPNGLASIAMEIPANDQQDVPGADGEDIPDPQNDACSDGEHPNEAGECVPDGSEYCDPDSQHFDIILRQCVQNEIVDACPQTPDVIDREIPAGGCTVPPPPPAVKPDLCINIPDKQETMPTGKMGDGVGGCVPIPVIIPDKTCTEQGKFDYSGPDRAGLTKGVCIPCPTNLFIQSNMTCFIVDSGVKKTDKTASGSGAGTKKSSGTSSGSGSTNGDSNELRGAALEGAGSLGGSQRLIRMPERGNTGPDASIYLALAGLAPAAAYAFRKLRK